MTRGVGGELPANVTTFLKGIDYPARKEQLVKHAQQNGAESSVIDVLQNMNRPGFPRHSPSSGNNAFQTPLATAA